MGELIAVENLQKHFPITQGLFRSKAAGQVKAVDGISFAIRQGETVALVGESGCGKTTTSKLLLGLMKPSGGRVLLEGRDIQHFKGDDLKGYRAKVQAVFQDPWASLDPRMPIRDIVSEAMVANTRFTRRDVKDRVAEVLEQVGLRASMADRYPHEFSGGQRQRIAVAAALASYPKLIVLDEPVSALDVSIRAQVMNLLKELQETLGVAYFLIAHNLATVRYMAHHTGVMYLGQIVEFGETEEVFSSPLHPYTKALLSASLPSHPDLVHDEIVLSGEVPSPIDPPAGCRFHPRCPWVMPRCALEEPITREVKPGHTTACHLYPEASGLEPAAPVRST